MLVHLIFKILHLCANMFEVYRNAIKNQANMYLGEIEKGYGIYRNPLIFMVGGKGIEPMTYGL